MKCEMCGDSVCGGLIDFYAGDAMSYYLRLCKSCKEEDERDANESLFKHSTDYNWNRI